MRVVAEHPDRASAAEPTCRRLAPGQVMTVGTYPNAQRFRDPANPTPGMDFSHSGDVFGRGCNMMAGTFIVDRIVFDPSGALRSLFVRFDAHCEAQPPGLRGFFSFDAG